MSEILCACATPYHVINAINIALMENCNTDIVIYNHFNDAQNLSERIKDTGVFRNVYFFDDNNYDKIHKIKRMIRSFFPSGFISFIAKKSKYDKMIFFALDFINYSYVIKKYEDRNIECNFSFGDDGVGTYCDCDLYSPSHTVECILKVNRRIKWLDKIKSLYVNTPILMKNKKYKLIEIKISNCLKDILCKLWEVKNQNINQYKHIYLQEPIIDCEKIDGEVIEFLKEEYGDGNVGVKLHPREQNTKQGLYNYIDQQVPFERIMLDFYGEKLSLYSVYSTAAITPVLLLKKNIDIVFLYKLLPEFYENNTAFQSLCERIQKNFDVKIYVPNSIEELKEL